MRLALLLFCTLSFPALAQVYKWTDENGVTHYGSQPPTAEKQEVIIRDTSPGRPAAAGKSDIVRQSRDLDRRNQIKELEQQQSQYNNRLTEIRNDFDSRPDYVCTGANDRLKSAQERWQDQKRQGYSISDRQYHEQRIKSLERSRDNLCR